MTVQVERVTAAETFSLRQRVLRPHQPIEETAFPGDDEPDSGHFAAFDTKADLATRVVLGTASVLREAPPWPTDDGPAWRLRGMATAEARRGEGIGAAVLAAVIDHVRANGGGLLWCNARLLAVDFYRRAGLVTRGESWDEPFIGPHIAMECLI
jgi:GNAT superfamily N-acetyltransferase